MVLGKMRDISVPEKWDRRGLPAWTYHSPALLEHEKEELFKTHWQIVCHVSDIPDPGSFLTFDLCGERALIVRDEAGQVKAFNNICRHRGSRLVAEESGQCPNALVCPFHGWVYNLDGTLRGAARPDTFPAMDKDEFALGTLDCEVWQGFVFIRFRPGPQGSVADLMQPFEAEASAYGMADNVPVDGIWTDTSPVNWKSIRDVDNEGYHVAMAHPALQDLYGHSYFDEPYVNGVSRSYAKFNPGGGRRWAVRHYTKFTQARPELPDNLANAWVYYGIFPNAVIGMTPESAYFYQEFPISTGQSLLRGGTYRFADETRQERAARYLAARIDRETIEEDIQLTIWSNESMASSNFEGFYLSDLEYGVRTHHDHLRAVMPIFNQDTAPPEESVGKVNAAARDA